jgi:hypothetical protein
MRSSVVVLKRGEPRHIMFAALAVPAPGIICWLVRQASVN